MKKKRTAFVLFFYHKPLLLIMYIYEYQREWKHLARPKDRHGSPQKEEFSRTCSLTIVMPGNSANVI